MFGRLLLLASLLLSLGSGFAAAGDASLPVKLVIGGDSSLSPQVVARLSGLAREPDLDATTIRKRLLDTQLFSTVEVERTKDSVWLLLRQKVTWFVVPYFSSDASGSYYSIAAGRAVIAHQDVFAFGWVQGGTSDHEARLGLQGRNLYGSAWDAASGVEVKHAPRWIYSGRSLVTGLDDQSYGGSLELGYRLSLPWAVRLTNYVEHHRFQLPSGSYEDGLQWSHRLDVEYNRFYVIEGLGQGQSCRWYFEAADPISDFEYFKAGAEAKIGMFQKGDFAWTLRPGLDTGWRLPYYQLFELGGMSLRGFPTQQFRGTSDFRALNDFFLQSWEVARVITRPLVFGDWAFIQGSGRTAAGLGLQFGVRDWVLSAIEVTGGYGWNPQGFSMSVSLGQRF